MKLRVVLFAALLLLFASGVMADQFDLTATGATTDINLVLTGDQISPGVYNITGTTGTIDGLAAALLATSGIGVVTNSNVVNGWFIQYDNLLNLNTPYVDYWGLGMSLADGSLVNLYYNGGYLYAALGNNPPFQDSVTIQNVPEPGTLALLCAGLLCLAFLVRKQLA
jgi:hypothetical protein